MGAWERLGRAVGLLALVATLSAASAVGGVSGSGPSPPETADDRTPAAQASASPATPGAPASQKQGTSTSERLDQGQSVLPGVTGQLGVTGRKEDGSPTAASGTSAGTPSGAAGGSLAAASGAASVSSAATGASPGAAAAASTAETKPRLITHVVAPGDTITGIAARYGLKVSTITGSASLANPNRIYPGQTLIFPSVDGILYRVKSGDTLSWISTTYQTDPEAITRANAIVDPDRLDVGQLLILPGGKPRIVAEAAAPRAVTTASSSPKAGLTLAWPLHGTLSSGFGPRWGRFHSGIDVAASYGATIRAAASGRVVYSGWYGQYGRCVIVDHGGGVKTLYGHASVLLVGVGENVTQGQAIAEVGTSGNSTGPHLHFEVRVNGQAQNPLRYLGG